MLRLIAFDTPGPDQSGWIQPLRLDTQLTTTCYLVDAVYLFGPPSSSMLVFVEGQSRAPTWPPDRTAALLVEICSRVLPGQHPASIHLLEVRLLDPASRQPRRRDGRLAFEPVNRLLDVDPTLPEFESPERWVLASFSRRVDDQWFAERVRAHQRLASSGSLVDTNFMDRLLLGLCGRARFPRSLLCNAIVEELMNEHQNPERTSRPGSQLSMEEILEIERAALIAGHEAARVRREEWERKRDEQLKAEVYGRVTAEVTERVTAEVRERVTAEVRERVTAELLTKAKLIDERLASELARAISASPAEPE
jgi:hypothetical protein